MGSCGSYNASAGIKISVKGTTDTLNMNEKVDELLNKYPNVEILFSSEDENDDYDSDEEENDEEGDYDSLVIKDDKYTNYNILKQCDPKKLEFVLEYGKRKKETIYLDDELNFSYYILGVSESIYWGNDNSSYNSISKSHLITIKQLIELFGIDILNGLFMEGDGR